MRPGRAHARRRRARIVRSSPRKARRRRTVCGLAALLLAVVSLACIQDDGTRWSPIDAIDPALSEDDERNLGMDFDRDVLSSGEVIQDPVVTDFIQELGQSLLDPLPEQPFIYRFRVVNASSLNAFAVPGGYIYLHSGTVLAASSVDELAGVLGHEIAHVRGRHISRMLQRNQIPNLLANIAALGAAIAAREPGILIAGQAINQSLQLAYSRELENEADSRGLVISAEAGFDPAGSARFFERILERHRQSPVSLPPYLFTHPQVADRIDGVRAEAARLTTRGARPQGFDDQLAEVQGRLEHLLELGRSTMPMETPEESTPEVLAEIRTAEEEKEKGQVASALTRLTTLALESPRDPRISYALGELLFEEGRYDAAIAAYRRTTHLDPRRSAVYFRLGEAFKKKGDRARALFAFESAFYWSRGTDSGAERRPTVQRADWEIEKLTFGVVLEAGFADGRLEDDAATPAGAERLSFPVDAPRLAYWARISPRFVPRADALEIRWIDPDGRVVQATVPEQRGRIFAVSVLELSREQRRPGVWVVETRLRDDVVDRREVEVRGATADG